MGEVRIFQDQLKLPASAKRLGQQSLRLYDNYLAYTIRQLEKTGWRLYCTSGCAACCHAMPAGVSIWELLQIYDYLQQSGQLGRFFRRNLESCQVLSRVTGRLGGSLSIEEPRQNSYPEAVLKAYDLERQPCAFLSDSQECLIYSLRPLACRMHLSFTPPDLCDPTHPNASQAVRLNLSPHAEVQDELHRLDLNFNLSISDLLAPGLVALAANVLRFSSITWI